MFFSVNKGKLFKIWISGIYMLQYYGLFVYNVTAVWRID